MEDRYKGLNRRQSVRLAHVLPAKFMLIDEETTAELTEMRPSSIHNISAGGALLEVRDLNEEWIEGLVSGMIKIALEIEIPDTKTPVRTLAGVVWFSKIGEDEQTKTEKYILGLRFIDITTISQDAIREYILRSYLG